MIMLSLHRGFFPTFFVLSVCFFYSRTFLDRHCLGILFSNKAFPRRVLGLAWRGDPAKKSGICQKRQSGTGVNLNSLFITLRTGRDFSMSLTDLPSDRPKMDITSGSGCPEIFKCPDSGLPFFSLPWLQTFNTFKVKKKTCFKMEAWNKAWLFFNPIHLLTGGLIE